MRHSTPTFAHILSNVWIPLLCLVLFLAIQPCASAATTVSVMTESGDFGTLNLNTGGFTELGKPGLTPGGMGELGGNLYIESAAPCIKSICPTGC
jgi:hypothetical protein